MSCLEETSWDPIKGKEFLCIPEDQLEILNSIPGWSQEPPPTVNPKLLPNVPVGSPKDSAKLPDVSKAQSLVLEKDGESSVKYVPARKRSLSLSSCTDYEVTEPKKLKSSSSESSLMELDFKEVDLKETHKSLNELFVESRPSPSNVEILGSMPQKGKSPKKAVQSVSVAYRVARLESLRENKMVISKPYSESCPLILAEEMIMMTPNFNRIEISRSTKEATEITEGKSPHHVPEQTGLNTEQLLQPEKCSVSVLVNAVKVQIVEQSPTQDILAQSSEKDQVQSSGVMNGDVFVIPCIEKENASQFKNLDSPISSSPAKKDVSELKDEENFSSLSIPCGQISASVAKDAVIEKSDVVEINARASGNAEKVPQQLLDCSSENNRLHSSVKSDDVFNTSQFKKPHTPISSRPAKKDISENASQFQKLHAPISSSPTKNDVLELKDEENFSSLPIPCGQIPLSTSVAKDAIIEKSDDVEMNARVSGNAEKLPQQLLDRSSENNQLHSSVKSDDVFNASKFKKLHTPNSCSPAKKDISNLKDEENLSSLPIPCGQIPPLPEESQVNILEINDSDDAFESNTVSKISLTENTAQQRSGKRSQKKKNLDVSIEYTPEQIKTMLELIKVVADI